MAGNDVRLPLPALGLLLLLSGARAAGAAAPPCAAGEPSLVAALELAFPERRAGLTVVVGSLALPAGDAEGAAPAYRLIGEVSSRERLVDRFELDFRPPPAVGPRTLDFVRELPPGHYRWLLELRDGAGRCLRLEREADVPVPAGETVAAPLVRLFGPLDRLLTGKTRVEADLRAGAGTSLAFELDGRRVMTRSRPPWSVELDLGPAPRLHRVAAVALGAGGRELARDELLLNAGPHRFAVRLALSPMAGTARRLEARATVELPEDERLETLDFEVDGQLRVRLRQPPYVARLELPAADAVSVRAVARLVGGGEAEVVRLAGGGYGDSVDVDFVELFATVRERGGRPLLDLRPDEVEIREDGRPQQLRRLERIENLPVHVGVLLDTSASMIEEIDTAARAALRFFEQVLTPRDRAAVITFADEPRLAVGFTGSRERLAGGLAELRADGNTALHDSVAFALHYFGGLGGKRALVMLSDGADSGSRLGLEPVLEFARRSGVAIYTIGLDVPSTPVAPGLTLDRLARETGGLAYRIDRVGRLTAIYGEIEAELRAQYLLAYQSDAAAGDDYRRVEVAIRRPGATAQTAPGYYP